MVQELVIGIPGANLLIPCHYTGLYGQPRLYQEKLPIQSKLGLTATIQIIQANVGTTTGQTNSCKMRIYRVNPVNNISIRQNKAMQSLFRLHRPRINEFNRVQDPFGQVRKHQRYPRLKFDTYKAHYRGLYECIRPTYLGDAYRPYKPIGLYQYGV